MIILVKRRPDLWDNRYTLMLSMYIWGRSNVLYRVGPGDAAASQMDPHRILGHARSRLFSWHAPAHACTCMWGSRATLAMRHMEKKQPGFVPVAQAVAAC